MPTPDADASLYNEMYLHNDATYDNPQRSPYLPMFRATIAEARRRGIRAVLEVGCGSGAFAQMLMDDLDVAYSGFDIAVEGVRKARLKNAARGNFFVGDATSPVPYETSYDGVICLEVLEHVVEDRQVIERWASGCHCICSVPNFDYETHVRKFSNEDEVRQRYGDLVAIERIARIRKPIWSGGLTFRGYLRRLWWDRENLRFVAGLLGINSFDNYAGWFLFSGRKR